MKELLLRVSFIVLPAALLFCLFQMLAPFSFSGYLRLSPAEAAAHVRAWGGLMLLSAAAFVACVFLYRKLD